MEGGCLILQLPSDLLAEIVANWIKAEDVGRLDSSCCNRYDRSVVLGLLKEKQVVLHSVHSKKYGPKLDARLKWILAREVKCTDFLVNPSTIRTNAVKCVKLSGDYLETFELCNSSNDSPTNLLKVVESHCHNLKTLKISFWSESTRFINQVIASNPYMQVLELSSVTKLSLDLQGARLTKLRLLNCLLAQTSFLASCATLLTLDLTGCSLPIVHSAMDIGTYCTQLQSLYLSDTSIDDDDILHIVTHCTALTALDVSSCSGLTDTGVTHIAIYGKHLQHLQIEYNDQLSNVSLNNISMYMQKSLNTLSIDSCSGFDAHSLAVLLMLCPKLTHLSTTIFEDAEIYLCKCNHIQKLDLLNLYMEPNICDAIATHCVNLHTLSLLYCKEIDAEKLHSIARGCSKLHTMKITTTNKALELVSSIKVVPNEYRDCVVVKRFMTNSSNIRCRW